MFKTLSKRAGFVLAIAGAAVVGGAATAIVSAAIPSSSDGKIHGCYRNNASLVDAKGAFRVIDSDAGQSCANQETMMNIDSSASKKYYAKFLDNGSLNTVYSMGVSNAKLVVDAGQDPNDPNSSFDACFDVQDNPRMVLAYDDNLILNQGAYTRASSDLDGQNYIDSICGSQYNAMSRGIFLNKTSSYYFTFL